MYDYVDEQIKKLGEYGYLELAAEREVFDDYLKRAKAKFPKVDFVKGVGGFAVGQIIFLPKARKQIIHRLERALSEGHKIVDGLVTALAKIK